MPTRDSIEEFNRTLVTLGNEPAVRARRNEDIEQIAPPEEGLSEDLSELLGEETGEGTEGAAGGAEEPEAPTEPEAEPNLPDAGEELDVDDIDIDEELAALGLEEAEAGTEEEPTPPEALEGEPAAAEPGAEEEPATPSPAAGEPAAGEEEDEFEDFDDLVSGEELAGLTQFEPEESEEAEELGAEDFEEPEEFDLSDFAGDFDFSAEEAEVPEFEGEEELEEAPAEEDFEEAFEAEEPAAEEPAAEEPAAEEPAGPETPETAEGEGLLAPEESDEFSFDFAEEEIPEPAAGAESGEEAGEEGFEEPDIPAPGAGEGEEEFTFEDESFELPEGEDFEEPSAEAGGGEEVGEEDIDEFSLGDFGAEFGVLEEAEEGAEEEAELNPALDVSGAPPPAPEDAAAPEVELSDEEFAALQHSLNSLPLNLKIAVEEAIAEQRGGPERTERLVRMLVEGETARHIADVTGKILGRRIEVPRGYEKRTGVSFEKERQSFAYRFRENILPIVRVVGLTMLAIAVVTFLAYRFVYRPLHAGNLYEQGLGQIEADRYAAGNELFDRAVRVWPVKSRFYEYAESFQDKRRYDLARAKYEQALRRYPGDKAGMLGYAAMESDLSNYPRADELLRVYLEGTGFPGGGYVQNREFMSQIMDMPPNAVPRIVGDPFDYDALLLRGDNFMAWAQEDSQYYENARRAYALALQHHGRRPELMFSFLEYFIETDNAEEVLSLTREFQADARLEIDTEAYARLGGYLLDGGRRMGGAQGRQMLDFASPVLMRAVRVARERGLMLPSAHYHLARYYRDLDQPVDERIALDNAHGQFDALAARGPLERRQVAQYIDTDARLGEYYYRREEYLTAREHFTDAIERYQRARDRGTVEAEPRFGRLHASYADLLYYVSREYGEALANYAIAEENGYSTRDIDYKQGFIFYREAEYQQALEHFFDAAGDYTQNRSVLYSTANALYHRDTLGAARGYYAELLEVLEAEREGIQNLLLEEDSQHRGLIEYLIKVQNNLGVTLQRLAQRSPQNGEVSSQGLEYLTAASEDAVNYNRNPRTGERGQSISLAYLNMREILYPQPEYDLQIYSAIPKDLDDVDF